jgi:hypothetical protein
MHGQSYVLVFTSVEAMVSQVRGAADAFVSVTYGELRRAWPNPAWFLAINPGSPLDAYLPVDALERAALGELDVPRAEEVLRLAVAETNRTRIDPGDCDATMRAARERGDWRAYFDALSIALLVVPTLRPVKPEALVERDFPWRIIGAPDHPTIEVFTSAETCAQVLGPEAAHVTIACPFVVAAWPDMWTAMAVNPGTVHAARIARGTVPLLMLWPGDGVELGPDELVAAFTAPDGPP